MKKLLLLSFCLIAFVISNAQVDVSTGGPVTTYTTLSAAFNAISSGTHTGAILINITASTTEPATATLEASGVGLASYTSVLIYPTSSGLTIAGALSGDTLIHLKGADNVTIDGRVNRTGARDLTIWNNAAAASANMVIGFTNDATFDTVMYATIKAQNTGTSTTTYGLVYFGVAATSGTGNDNNVIDNCDIDGMSNSTILLNSNGTGSPSQNSGIIISNNLFHDFYLGTGVTTGTGGIRFGAGNTDITVTGNSLYQTAPRAYSATTNAHSWIEFNSTTGNGHVISKNYVGGTLPFCGGSPLTITGGAVRLFGLFSFSVGTTNATRVDSNVIRNMDITSAFATAGSSPFIGFDVAAGAVNFLRDTVGASVGVNSIKLTVTANTGAILVGYNIRTITTVNLTNCVAGSMTGIAAGSNIVHVYPISIDRSSASLTHTIDGCLIGSLSTPYSIQSTIATSTQHNIHGIRLAPAASQNLNCVVKTLK